MSALDQIGEMKREMLKVNGVAPDSMTIGAGMLRQVAVETHHLPVARGLLIKEWYDRLLQDAKSGELLIFGMKVEVAE